MNRIHTLVILVIFLLVSGCKSARKQADESSKYKRKAIVEVSQERLNNDAMLIEAKMQYELGNAQDAWKLYHQLLKNDSNYAAAHYELATMCFDLGMYDSTLYYVKKAYGLAPKNEWYALLLADMYKRMYQLPKAVKVMETLVKQQPEVLEYHHELASIYIANNEVEKAVEVYNKLEKRIGVSEEISLRKQKIWESAGKTDKAVAEIKKLAEAYPKEKKYNLIMAELYMSKKDYDKAYAYYDRVLEADPDDEYIHISVANYYKCVNKHDKAYNELKKGFENNKLSTKEKIQILTTFYTSEEFYGKYSKYAYDLVDVVLHNATDTMSYSLFYGDVLMRQGKYAEAARQLNNYISIDSSEYDIWEALLICESEMPHNDKNLLKLCNRVLNLFPIYPLPYYMKGFILYADNKYSEAIETLLEGEKWATDTKYLKPDILSLLAECFYKVNDSENSFKYFEKYIKIIPDDMGMLNNYAYYLSQNDRDLDKAEQMSRQTIDAQPDNSTFLDTYAWILYKMERYAEAEKYMKRAIEKDSTPSATLYRHYADIVNKLNMPDEAKKYREKAKKLEMDSYQEIPDDMKVKIE